MNCRIFETLIIDLAREHLMDATARRDAIAHAAGCERCAARLAAERNLTAGLKTLGAADRTSVASEGLEARLLMEFRRTRVAAPAPARAVPANRWLWAAAAGLLLTLGIYAYRSLQPVKSGTASREITTTVPVKSPDLVQAASDPNAEKNSAEPERGFAVPKTTARRSQKSSVQKPKYLFRDEITTYSSTPQYASEFFTLDPGGNYPPMDQGQIIRVEVPRPALVRMGLPINAELADIPVKADLLVGEDGLARAIRFIR